jgi:4-amino-4-deoxy-L-arabinose transferase-like glycosyltransferase
LDHSSSTTEKYRLSLLSWAILLLYGGSILLIDLGGTRVLTRHEVLAAQPAREMLRYWKSSKWVLPTFAGEYRTAKPPGMMWLIAASLAVFHTDAEWAARLPSALSGLAVALMIAALTARWYGEKIGRLAGLLIVSSVYILTQAKLSEADMPMSACVCAALAAFAVAAIESPIGKVRSAWPIVAIWLDAAAGFMLKGPIALVFIGAPIVAFAIIAVVDHWSLAAVPSPEVRRPFGLAHWITMAIGLIVFVTFVAGWPLLARHLYSGIVKDWQSEAIGTTTGKWGTGSRFFYFGAVPILLLPWTPFTIGELIARCLRFLSSPGREARDDRQGSLSIIRHTNGLAIFLACWFLTGFVYLSLGVALKSNHYVIPVLPPLAVLTSMGLIRYFESRRHQAADKRKWIAPAAWGIGCAVAVILVFYLHQVPAELKSPLIVLIAIVAVGGWVAIFCESARRMNAVLITWLATAWAVAIGVQALVMPAQDDYRFQADFARQVNLVAPKDAMIYMIGRREEEHEAQYAYYLRFPMRRIDDTADIPAKWANLTRPIYAIAPRAVADALPYHTQTLLQCPGLRLKETEDDRLLFIRVGD